MIFSWLQLKAKQYPLIFCIVSSLFWLVGWPPSPFAPVLFICLIPLLLVLLEIEYFKKIILYSFITFFINGIITMHWVSNVEMDLKGSVVLYLFGYIFMAFLMSLPITVFAWTKRRIKSPVAWIALPVYWITYEYLQGHWDLAFMWLHLGLGLSCYPKWIQFYEITGRLGGTFLIISINIIFYLLLKYWCDQRRKKILFCTLFLIIGIVSITNLLLTNSYQLSTNKAKIAIVQGNMNPYEKVNEQVFEKQFTIFEELVLSVKEQKPDMIVCSEGFFKGTDNNPFVINEIDSNATIKKLKELSRKVNTAILTGIITYKLYYTQIAPTPSAQLVSKGIYYDAFNAAMLISYDQPIQVYTKSKLVPFMERVPFLEKFSFIETLHLSLNRMSGSYGRTDETSVFTYKNLKIAPVICMESLFPDYVKKFVEKDANIIAIMTDDGWSGNSNGPKQHASFAVPLAIEMRKPIARSANTGISLFLASSGNIIHSTELNEQTIIVEKLTLNTRTTFFVKHGELIGLMSIGISAVFFVITFLKGKNISVK